MATQNAKPTPVAKHQATAPGSMIPIPIPEESRVNLPQVETGPIESIGVVIDLTKANHAHDTPDQATAVLVGKTITDLLCGRITVAAADNALVEFWQDHLEQREALTDDLKRLQMLGERLYQNTTVFQQIQARHK